MFAVCMCSGQEPCTTTFLLARAAILQGALSRQQRPCAQPCPLNVLLPLAVCCFVDSGISVQGRMVLLALRSRDVVLYEPHLVLDEPDLVLDELSLSAWGWGLPKSG